MFEWNQRARLDNLRNNGVDFVRAALMFENPVIEREDVRQFAGEKRHIAIGHSKGYFMVVVSSPRGARCRILEAWKADDEDERIYREAIPQTAASDEGLHGRRRAIAGQSRPELLGYRPSPLPLPKPQGRSTTSGS